MTKRYESGFETVLRREEETRIASSELAERVEREGFISSEPNYNESTVNPSKVKEESWFRFGNGLKAVPFFQNAGAHKIYKEGKQIAKTSISPFNSFEDSGLFLCKVEDDCCRFMNGEGEFCFGVYGKHTGPFYQKMARIDKRDGTLDFINTEGKPLGLKLQKATNFVYDDNGRYYAEVRFVGAKKSCYINQKGEVVNTPRYNSQAYLDEIGETEQGIE